MKKVFLLAQLFDSDSLFQPILPISWEESTFREAVSNLVDLDGLARIVLSQSKNLRQWGFPEFRNSLGDIGIRLWLTTTDQLRCEHLYGYLLSDDVEPTAFYVWPSENPDDEKGMREFEALLLSLLKQSNSGPSPQTTSAAAKASSKQFTQS